MMERTLWLFVFISEINVSALHSLVCMFQSFSREEENKAKEEIISKLSKTIENAEKAMEMLEKVR